MQPTGDRTGTSTGGTTWEAPLEADVADAQEQVRDLIDGTGDPEASAAGPDVDDLDLEKASEADLAEQLHEVSFDDDGDR